jgi:branched-chain amino acid transport system permease protein
MTSAYVLSQVINGLILGSMYALIAIGFSMIYGIVQLINFAHGDIFAIGAFVTLACLAG